MASESRTTVAVCALGVGAVGAALLYYQTRARGTPAAAIRIAQAELPIGSAQDEAQPVAALLASADPEQEVVVRALLEEDPELASGEHPRARHQPNQRRVATRRRRCSSPKRCPADTYAEDKPCSAHLCSSQSRQPATQRAHAAPAIRYPQRPRRRRHRSIRRGVRAHQITA